MMGAWCSRGRRAEAIGRVDNVVAVDGGVVMVKPKEDVSLAQTENAGGASVADGVREALAHGSQSVAVDGSVGCQGGHVDGSKPRSAVSVEAEMILKELEDLDSPSATVGLELGEEAEMGLAVLVDDGDKAVGKEVGGPGWRGPQTRCAFYGGVRLHGRRQLRSGEGRRRRVGRRG